MSKILLGAAVIAAAAFASQSAYAMGGGWTPPWASAWYNPNGPSAAIEGRSAFKGESAAVQPRGGVVAHEQGGHRSHRRTPAAE